jgi:hypothetical protein
VGLGGWGGGCCSPDDLLLCLIDHVSAETWMMSANTAWSEGSSVLVLLPECSMGAASCGKSSIHMVGVCEACRLLFLTRSPADSSTTRGLSAPGLEASEVK